MHSLARLTVTLLVVGFFISPHVGAIAADTPQTKSGAFYPTADGGVRSLHVATLLSVDGQIMTVEDKGSKWMYTVNEGTTYCIRGKKSSGRVVPKVLVGKVLRIVSAAGDEIETPSMQPIALTIYDLESGPIELSSFAKPPVFPPCK